MKENEQKSESSLPKKTYCLLECGDGWRASSLGGSWNSGWLSYNKLTQHYSAGYRESKIIFPKLRSGNYADPEDCPLDEHGRPKSDFLMLLALREQFQFDSPGRRSDPLGWRKQAIDSSIAERERDRGSPLPEKNRKNAEDIISSFSKFEKRAGSWLAELASEQNGGKAFRRLAGWMDAIDRLEEIGIHEDYRRFFSAVEVAARQAGGVPTQKAVRSVFEAKLSANQTGQGSTFRSLKDKLKFQWLPVAGRGPGSVQKKSGI